MAKRGRPSKVFNDSDLSRIIQFATRMTFRTKAQQELYEAEHSRIISASHILIDHELLALIKTVNRQRNIYRKNTELFKMIQHKANTAMVLTELEKEILAYDLNDRDGFFSCQRALTTYAKLEKIVKSEIERKQSELWQEKVKKGKENQSEAQKKRIADNRRKYFLGGVLQKYVSFLKENGLSAVDASEEQILAGLIEDTIMSKFLSDATGGDEVKAASVKKSIQAKHPTLMNALSLMAQEVVLDKRKGDEV